jgi:hypothetical protein
MVVERADAVAPHLAPRACGISHHRSIVFLSMSSHS